MFILYETEVADLLRNNFTTSPTVTPTTLFYYRIYVFLGQKVTENKYMGAITVAV
jgi:hypothetical protein